MMNVPGATSRAELSVKLGVSRARVTQVLSVLDSSQCVQTALERLERNGVIITTRKWLDLKGMSVNKLLIALETLSHPQPSSTPILPGEE